jgi:hypothetical protein
LFEQVQSVFEDTVNLGKPYHRLPSLLQGDALEKAGGSNYVEA